MVDCPFDSELQVKRKVETKGLSWWFADVPEGGDVGDTTYLCLCVKFNFFLAVREFSADRSLF